MTLKAQIQALKQANKDFTEKASTSGSFSDRECITFNDVKLHEDMHFEFFTDEKLNLAHVITHTVYATNNRKRKYAQGIHKKVVSEMDKRKIPHTYFDNLDKSG